MAPAPLQLTAAKAGAPSSPPETNGDCGDRKEVIEGIAYEHGLVDFSNNLRQIAFIQPVHER